MTAAAFILSVAALVVSLATAAALVWIGSRVAALAGIVVPRVRHAENVANGTIHADRDAEPITAAQSGAATAIEDRREIRGLIVPYDVPGDTSAGPVSISAGALTLPDDLSRIKLLYGHDRERPVGYLTATAETARGLEGVFAIAPGADGDAAIEACRARIRDGLSYEVSRVRLSDDGSRVTAARLDAVALCSVPAYDDARALAASRQDRNMFTLETARAALANAESSDADRAAAAAFMLAHPDATDADRASAAEVVSPTGEPNVESDGGNVEPAVVGAETVAAGRAPAGITAGRRSPTITAAQGVERLAAALRGASDAGQVNAALADVIPANDAGLGFMGQGQWVGEFWTAQATRRDFLDSFQRGVLTTGVKVHGWRWVNKPQVGPWAGKKTEIPTNAVSTEPAEASIERTAGGWDVDRIFFDLGDASFLSSFLAAAVADYAAKTEAGFAADILAAATTAPASTDLVTGLNTIAQTLSMRGAQLSSVAMSADVFADYLAIPASDAPWWLARQGSVDLRNAETTAAGVSVSVVPGLPANTVIGADRRAATYYEAAGSPIRVQAVNVPLGGIDLGVYGYHATLIHDETAIVSTTVGA